MLSKVVVKFAGDSGDGIQLTGSQFTNTTARSGSDIVTLPDFPAEIRAPAGSVAGVSGFQIQFGSGPVLTAGDACDVLVVMNAAALKSHHHSLRPGGLLILNANGFEKRNLKLAGYGPDYDPQDDPGLKHAKIIKLPVTKLTRECLSDTSLKTSEKDRCKNMFVLGLLYWVYGQGLEPTKRFLKKKFLAKPEIAEANLRALSAGNHYGETIEAIEPAPSMKPTRKEPGRYRLISGNQAIAYGLVAAGHRSRLGLFYASYPITPASDILHVLSRHRNFDVTTFQAEDEIAAVAAGIGAAFAGKLAATASSGPGMSLKSEGLGLAVALELPMVVIDVQRAGPSTGMPTKTEQADLLQALFGRHGECPLPVLAPRSPSDCFELTYQAALIALQFMTPVIVLSDALLANGTEPWRIKPAAELDDIVPMKPAGEPEDKYLPYARDERLARPWAIPGMPGREHRVGGLEKEDVTGDISYDPANHEQMVRLRAEKVNNVTEVIGDQPLESGPARGDLLILGWGSTYGAIASAAEKLRARGASVSHCHLRHLNPLPANLGDLLHGFRHVLVPENNMGQLVRIIRDRYLLPAVPLNKIQGTPFRVSEIMDESQRLIASGPGRGLQYA